MFQVADCMQTVVWWWYFFFPSLSFSKIQFGTGLHAFKRNLAWMLDCCLSIPWYEFDKEWWTQSRGSHHAWFDAESLISGCPFVPFCFLSIGEEVSSGHGLAWREPQSMRAGFLYRMFCDFDYGFKNSLVEILISLLQGNFSCKFLFTWPYLKSSHLERSPSWMSAFFMRQSFVLTGVERKMYMWTFKLILKH